MSSLRRNQSVTSVLLKGRANGAPTRIGRARRCSANRAHDEPLMAPSLGDALIAVSHTRPSSARVSSPVHTRPPQLTPAGVTPPHVAVLRCRVTARPQRRLQRAPRLPQARDAVRISHCALCNSVCASRETRQGARHPHRTNCGREMSVAADSGSLSPEIRLSPAERGRRPMRQLARSRFRSSVRSDMLDVIPTASAAARRCRMSGRIPRPRDSRGRPQNF